MTTTPIVASPASFPRMFGRARHFLMGLGPRDVQPVLQHFSDADPAIRDRLGAVVHSFVAGYNLALLTPDLAEICEILEHHESERRGFAYEGAGMGIALRALMVPNSTILADYLRGPADRHHYIVQVGAGWAMARFPFRHSALRLQMDPAFHWLAWDGYGFHQTIFSIASTVDKQYRPALADYAASAFDQGVGRALWFVRAADPERVAGTIARFPQLRQSDLWGGVGLAAAYAGGVSVETLRQLVALAGPYHAELATGSLMAWVTRHRAGNMVPHTQLAVETFCGGPASEWGAETLRQETAAGRHDGSYPLLRQEMANKIRNTP